jgi:predicted ester cyclase
VSRAGVDDRAGETAEEQREPPDDVAAMPAHRPRPQLVEPVQVFHALGEQVRAQPGGPDAAPLRSTASSTASATRGQNGGPSGSVTSIRGGTAVASPEAASGAATGVQVSGPSSRPYTPFAFQSYCNQSSPWIRCSRIANGWREAIIINLPGLPEPLHGREIWKLGVKAMRDGFPDLHITIEDIFGAGDRVAVRLNFSGTHTGEFQGVPATHRRVAFSSIDIYRVEGDKLAEEWVSPDMMGLMQQISDPTDS